MANKKILAIVAALMMSATTMSAHAAYSFSNLQRIEVLVSAQNWSGLRSYLLAHPELLEGGGVLSIQLNEFLVSYSKGFSSPLFDPPSVAVLDRLQDSY